MVFKTLFFISLLFSFALQSQRRNAFPDSDKIPNCGLIKKGTFSRHDKSNSRFKIKFNNNKMTEIYGKNIVTIESDIKMLDKCKFEAEIMKLQKKEKTILFIIIGALRVRAFVLKF